MKPCYRCWAEIDLDALRDNLAWIRRQIGPGVKILTVVKADAYGHGLKQTAALLMQSGTDIFGVANLTEARMVRIVGGGWPVLMLGACLPGEIEAAIHDDVMPTISSLEEARHFSGAATRLGKKACVHIKVDTGMGRLGVAMKGALRLIREVHELPGLWLHGLYTHYACVEDDAAFSRVQRRRFGRLLNQLIDLRIQVPLIHANNSGALVHEPGTLYNLVRPGLLVYGVVPPGRRRQPMRFHEQLRPALSLKCRVSFIKEIPSGTPLSYGRTFIAQRSMRVATLTAGYGDGYLRAGSNRSEVLIAGKRCPALGRITMDQTIVDVSAAQEVKVGDEAVLIGRQGSDVITVNDVASRCGAVPWEVLTGISYRVPRIYQGGCAA